jgi:sterol desaturase/sphingolipid hydroxylase (fatty acid hydroxylase superfamily)
MSVLALAFTPAWTTEDFCAIAFSDSASVIAAQLDKGVSVLRELANRSASIALEELGIGTACFVLAFILGSFVEYWMHRLMHASPRIGERHRDHHRRNEGQGVLWEFRDYVRGSLVVMCLLFFHSWSAGIGWFLGGLVYAAFSAYAHQLQHENPTKCFWMKMPVHYVHHKYGMWHHNFGLAVDWWDRVFGTYKPVEWLTQDELAQRDRGYFQLRWW